MGWCNFSSLMFTPLESGSAPKIMDLDLDPDPYEHFWDPGSGSPQKRMRIQNTALKKSIVDKLFFAEKVGNNTAIKTQPNVFLRYSSCRNRFVKHLFYDSRTLIKHFKMFTKMLRIDLHFSLLFQRSFSNVMVKYSKASGPPAVICWLRLTRNNLADFPITKIVTDFCQTIPQIFNFFRRFRMA